ncbi:hypothetical protein SAMN05444377_1078 [Flavobacterium fontis]|uniref:Lysozyme inhibitor LprI N-terminal domain-containing protein n=1 Tax=Flavobacterium fontis TaxID=1124188 RepID=A0A1M5AVA5_9FLAO|nr:hypothetical protein [Flavobacterium fontis]SHF34150.1 hypothetical protein SAMN05444377_1078 [Flavobacterium fontis]
MMKSLLTLGIFFIFSISKAQSDPLNILEQKIENECFNCNQSDLNNYLNAICNKREYSLDSICKEFDKKVSTIKNDSAYKMKLVKLKNETLNDLKNIRKKNILNFLNLKETSSENDYNGYFLYIYWMDRGIELIKYYIRSIDFI